MKILLTGAFGYLGGRVATWLREAGNTVVLSGLRLPRGAEDWAGDYEVRLGDILNPDDLPRLVDGVQAVVNFASLNEIQAAVDPKMALLVSGEGNRLLLSAAKDVGVRRFLFFSTFHVYGPSAPHHITEDTPTQAAHPYSISHLAGEGYCHEANRLAGHTWSISMRLSNAYGCPIRRDIDRWTLAHNDFCRQAVENGKIVLHTTGTQERDFVWIDDVASAISVVLQAPDTSLGNGIFNLGGNNVLSIRSLAKRVSMVAQKRLGKTIPIEFPMNDTSLGPGTKLKFDISRLEKLGYKPIDRIDQESERIFDLLLDDS